MSPRPIVEVDALSGRCLPYVAQRALAGVAAGGVGELAVERAGQRNAIAPVHFGAGADQRGVGRRLRAVHREGRARQLLKCCADRTVGVAVTPPGQPSEQAGWPQLQTTVPNNFPMPAVRAIAKAPQNVTRAVARRTLAPPTPVSYTHLTLPTNR